MSRDTHFTGACSELEVAKRLASLGWEIFFPLMTQSQIDLVACKDSETIKVQVKTVSKITVSGKQYLQARLQSRGSGASGYTRNYTENQFDKIAFVFEDQVWLCPWELFFGNKSVTLGRFENNTLQPRKRFYKDKPNVDFSKYELKNS